MKNVDKYILKKVTFVKINISRRFKIISMRYNKRKEVNRNIPI